MKMDNTTRGSPPDAPLITPERETQIRNFMRPTRLVFETRDMLRDGGTLDVTLPDDQRLIWIGKSEDPLLMARIYPDASIHKIGAVALVWSRKDEEHPA